VKRGTKGVKKSSSAPNEWLKSKVKLLQNTGQAYISSSKSKKAFPKKRTETTLWKLHAS
jgi:hypothetical protein